MKVCGVHRNTTFRWRHRFLTLPNEQKARSLVGIAEADETFFLESFKGIKKGMTRAPRHRGGKSSKRGLPDEQIPVLICRDRTEAQPTSFWTRLTKRTSARRSNLCWQVIQYFVPTVAKPWVLRAGEIGISHRPINLAAGIRVAAGFTMYRT